MTCGCGRKASASVLRRRRALQAGLFQAGKVAAAQRHRWQHCGHASACGMACANLEKEAGRTPSCVDADTGRVLAPDLYAALKRPEFLCPTDRF